MDRIENIRDTCSFQFKKWALFTFCAVGIVILIVMASIGSKLMDTYVDDNYPSESAANRKAIKETAVVLIWVIFGLGILFNLVGLMGAYKEHYCMTVTYAVLITLSALSAISTATRNPTYWLTVVFDFMICGLVYAYAYDLRRIRVQRFNTPVFITTTGAPTGTVIQIAPGQVYIPAGPAQPYAPPQYSGQYGQPQTGPAPMGWNPPPYASPESKTNY